MTTRSAAERPQDTPGQHRDASGHLKDTPDGLTDLVDTWMGFTDLCFSVSMGGVDHWISGC